MPISQAEDLFTDRSRVRRVEMREDGCWVWMARRTPDGYGQVTVDYRSRLAHRVAYELFVGPIPEGLSIDHLCRNRSCINPEHLEPVTPSENSRRARADQYAETCGAGHPWTPASTYIKPNGNRGCRSCRNAAVVRYRKKG